MAAKKSRKLYQVAKELNHSHETLIEELESRGYSLPKKHMTPVPEEMYEELLKYFAPKLYASHKEELHQAEAAEKARKTQEVRQADLQAILQSGTEEVAKKPAPTVRQHDPSFKPEKDSIEDKKDIKEEPVSVDLEAESSTEEADLPVAPRKRVAPSVRDSARPIPQEEKPAAKVEKEVEPEVAAEEVSPQAQKQTSVRGAVSNDDILQYTPTEKTPEKPKPESTKKKQKDTPVAGSSEDEKDESKDKSKRKRKRKTRKKDSEPEVAKDQPWAGTEDKSSGGKKKKKRDRRKRKKVDEKEVQESIRLTMAAMEDSGKKKKRRRVERDVGIVDEEVNLLKVTEFISTAELASLIDVPTGELIRECLMLGLRVTINQRLDRDTIQILAEEHEYKVEFVDQVGEEELIQEEEIEDKEEDLEPRAPVITVMGHVDHGKTSLLDYIRETRVAEGEAGGITQHIGAYEVKHKDQVITFLDTPGHAAFTAMRARGAQATDVVVLVVAADDLVMPQTKEAIDHSKAANVPMVIAINKMDKPGANADKVRRQLSEYNVYVEEYGGDVLNAEVSAKTGAGIDDLLDKILLSAEILELRANPNTLARGIIIESRIEKGRGTVCTVLVQRGTLKVGDVFVAGPYFGRVRAMYDEVGGKRKSAGPAQPIEITGFESAPHVGDQLVAYKTEHEAKEVSSNRQQQMREQEMRLREGFKGNFLQNIDGTDRRELRLILKGDVDGSVEAIADSLMRLTTDEVSVKIIHRSVGPINENDVLLASASKAMIIGFNIHPNQKAREMAQRDEVEFKTYRIIYELIQDITDILTGMYKREFVQEVVGAAEVRNLFKISRLGVIAGCMVTSGKMEKSNRVRVLRDGVSIYEGELDSLKRFKDDAKEVATGFECGIKVANFNDIKVGDVVESLVEVEVEREIEMDTHDK
ncbi:translation initiation factor IF-2 [bacterium]|nr:translation initiation factor IF-2 [bacterium]